MLQHKRISLAAVLVLVVACTGDSGSPVGPSGRSPAGPAFGIFDAAHNGGRAGFYFLPPLVKQPAFSGTFDAGLAPEVRVCRLTTAAPVQCVAGPPLASWTMSGGTGGAAVTVDAAAGRYEVAWDTKLSSLNVASFYRIVVLVGGVELGYADVDPVSSGSDLKNVNTNEYIALKDGRTLPIAFRIETGTLGAVTVSPARDTVPAGGSAPFTATVTDLHGNPVPGAVIAWSSSNPAVATVSPAAGAATTATAAATLPAEDSARIVAASGGAQGAAVLVVTPQPAEVAPDAVDDAHSVARNGTVAAPPAASLLANDALGAPPAEIDSIGGGFLGGGVRSFFVAPGAGITISPLPGYASGSLTVSRDGSFSFTPPADSVGTFSFRYLLKNAAGADSATVTFTVDGPPAVTTTSPANGATGLADSINVVVSFSEPVAAAPGAFLIECPVGTAIAFTQSASPGASYTLDPTAPLPWGTECRVTVDATKITDLGATPQNLPANHVFTFTIDAAPRVIATTPVDGATSVASDASIVVTFSESVNATVASFTIDCGTTQPFSLSPSPAASFTLDPTNGLPYGSSCTVTVHAAGITDADAGDPPDGMAADTSFTFTVPIVANDDAYPQIVTGNLLHNSANISTPFSVLANDLYGSPVQVTDVSGSATVSAGTITGTTAQGGTVVMTVGGTDAGKFTYDPPRGHEGADQFTYTIQLVSNPASTATATVSLSVAGMVWFIDNGSGCASSCDGRWSHPYPTLAAFEADNGDGGSDPEAGDHVFVYESATDYTGPLTLLNGQRLIGQDASQTLAALTGITPSSGSTPFPVTNAGNATEARVSGGGITLGQNNRVHGLRLGTTSGTGIAGASFGTLTVDDVKILAAGVPALSLAGGTASVVLDSLSSSGGARNVHLAGVGGTVVLGTGALSGSTAAALADSAGSGTVTYAGSIASGSGRSVSIRSRSGGSVSLSGNLTDAAAGLLVQGSSGAISFTGAAKTFTTGAATAVSLVGNAGASIVFAGGGLAITTTSGAGFSATGGGTVQVTGAVNTVNTGAGTAVDIQNTTIGASGVVFQSVSANGATQGIVVSNTGSGGFGVTGDGSTAGSGGTIQNTSGDGVRIATAQNASLQFLNLTNIAAGVNNAAICHSAD
ncbi:MAG TPA: Ig-like domain-containing protein, partial [Longimicrobium sp.]|nr:Ig-like domain-containing protein [Longimicrobium sp.]